MILASLHDYLPLNDLLKIVLVCAGVAVIAPAGAALVITGFEVQTAARGSGRSRVPGDVRIALGVAIIAALIFVGLYALVQG
jgi:hypothetical protein